MYIPQDITTMEHLKCIWDARENKYPHTFYDLRMNLWLSEYWWLLPKSLEVVDNKRVVQSPRVREV